jgi:hypothetical protein
VKNAKSMFYKPFIHSYSSKLKRERVNSMILQFTHITSATIFTEEGIVQAVSWRASHSTAVGMKLATSMMNLYLNTSTHICGVQLN